MYELRLFNLGGSTQPLMTMQRLLGLNLTSTAIHPLEIHTPDTILKASAQDGVKLCGLICAYRLLDVIASMDDLTPRSPKVDHRLLTQNIVSIYV